ncbi:MAG: hypothetical protein LBU91_07245, partial [Bacteroidales bacterium]|nr:hypothetical protein [Bacteroidales bacterium]
MKRQLLSSFLMFSVIILHAQSVIYVKPNATGSGNSWADACDLETAVKKATSGAEVWVQAGTYNPKTMLTVPISVKLYGSFTGTESSIAARNMASNPTIIDAQNKYGSVVRLEPSAVLNGFTIQNGNAQNNPHKSGGGVYAEDNTVIENCKIINNTAVAYGGGVYAKESLEIINSTIENNTTAVKGNDVFGCCILVDAASQIVPIVCTHPSAMAEHRAVGVDLFDFNKLSVNAVGSGPFTYQWYSNTANSTTGGTLIADATSDSYTPSRETVSTLYYYVVVTNSHGSDTSDISGLHTVAPLIDNFDYTGAYRAFSLHPGTYVIECWGAQGGQQVVNKNITANGANGGYSKGILTLSTQKVIYCYVGGTGSRGYGATGGAGGWNGGAKGGNDAGSNNDDVGGGGGGASDIRVSSGAWNDATSLRSRIMVAGGGGGNQTVGVGGGLNGGVHTGASSTQNAGYSFGTGQVGGSQPKTGATGNGGGGGGWYGGRADAASGT